MNLDVNVILDSLLKGLAIIAFIGIGMRVLVEILREGSAGDGVGD